MARILRGGPTRSGHPTLTPRRGKAKKGAPRCLRRSARPSKDARALRRKRRAGRIASVAEASMEGQAVPAGRSPWRRWGVAAVCAAVLAGAVFRLAWVEDMEYKADEQWMFERACRVGVSEPFPWLGPPSGSGVRHSGGI